jgi:AraC-like DNA-binding protein
LLALLATNMIQRTSSSAWVSGVVEMFAAEGVDTDALFIEAGLNIARLNDPENRFSIDDVNLLWELAVARSGKTTLGLSRELAIAYSNPGLVRYAMMASPTLQVALERLLRYMSTISDAATTSMTPMGDSHWIELGLRGGERSAPRQRIEFGSLTLLTLCSWFTGRELNAIEVEFAYPPPPDASAHLRAFGCPVRFGAEANRALLRNADLALPLSARNRSMAALHDRLLDREIQLLEGTSISLRVRNLLQSRPLRPEPRREQIALALGIGDRTLQRRLRTEGVSFQQLLDEIRREVAQQYLRQPGHSLKRVAEQLGFEDQSNLFRACKRWFGMSPGRYRDCLSSARATGDGASPQ